EGEELFFVIKGEITVEVDEERVILRTGDSYHFDSTRTHCTWNHRTEVATLLWCGTMDVFGLSEIESPHQIPEKMARSSRVSPLYHVRMSTNLQEEKT
ncbi:MAG: cupin domain-containing protein, partial [Alphaproteobacteria bacterium]|nr:cupin domain-containing protein [Alphaproteobacteria bacterium]